MGTLEWSACQSEALSSSLVSTQALRQLGVLRMDGNFWASGHIGMVSLFNSLRPCHHLLYLLGL